MAVLEEDFMVAPASAAVVEVAASAVAAVVLAVAELQGIGKCLINMR